MYSRKQKINNFFVFSPMSCENIYSTVCPRTQFHFRKSQLFIALYLPYATKIHGSFLVLSSYGNENQAFSYLFASTHLFSQILEQSMNYQNQAPNSAGRSVYTHHSCRQYITEKQWCKTLLCFQSLAANSGFN